MTVESHNLPESSKLAWAKVRRKAFDKNAVCSRRRLRYGLRRATVHSAAGALGRTDFRLGDGHWVNPFHEAPWLGRAAPIDPPMLGNLRGDWACIPFGRPYGAADGLPERWATAAAIPQPSATIQPTRMPTRRADSGFAAVARIASPMRV